MIRKNDKRKAGSSCCQKVLAVLLAVTLACSSSGMLSLAEEASRENMEGYVDPEAQAAEEAARIAEEQAAAEEAARIAEEQAAAEEAARIAEEQAAAEQRAAESAEELPEETSEAELEEARALAETEPEAAWTSYEAEPVLLQICFSQFPGEKTPAHSEVLEIWQFLTAEDGTPDAVLVAEAGEKSEGRVDIGEMQAEFTTAALGTSYGVRFPLYS